MLHYRGDLKQAARNLRSNMTDAERLLWLRLRGKQIVGVQFYRQKPVGPYVVDFYAPAAKLVVEVDGAQHFEGDGRARDERRDAYLGSLGLKVLRFDNMQVLKEAEAVLQVIYAVVETQMKSPLRPPFSKGGTGDSAASPPFEKGGLGGISPRGKP